MKRSVFISRSLRGRWVYEQSGDRLRVTGKNGFKNFDISVDLKDIAPHSERVVGRPYMMIVIGMPCAIATAVATWGTKFLPIPRDLHIMAYTVGAVFVGTFLWTSSKGLISMEWEVLRTKAGIPIFDLVKENGKLADFEQFLSEIREAITNASGDKPTAS